MDPLFAIRPECPGYRLHRLEVFNWGTFDSTDGHVFRFEPEGRTSLLVGHNGSGKSTLVDAVLTLMVPSNIRNYNVAAGAKKTERNEKSYIRGAYGRSSDESQATVIQYLRSKGSNFTALAAVFRDEQLDQAFTLCQVLHLTADGSVDKVFAIIDDIRELKADLSGVHSSNVIRHHLDQLGYQTTKKYIEYQGWVVKRTKMRGKAMDMFNQTVAVKDIQSLNDFIRRHMLEVHDWREKVARLLKHFNDLSVAHQELMRARKAEELLTPVEQLGRKYSEQSTQLDENQRRLDAAETFFRCETVRLFEPRIAAHEEDLVTTLAAKSRISEELKTLSEKIRQIKNEIDQAGGQRLRDLPLLIEREQVLLASKQNAFGGYSDQLRDCEVTEVIADGDAFAEMRKRLKSIVETATGQLITATQTHEGTLTQCGQVRRQLCEEETELEMLGNWTTNLPSHLATLRSRICEDLQLAESDLPFAAELISIDPQERHWEASAEMVLRSFALSLLVPERFYRRVRAYVEQTEMTTASGRGQRLVYLRVGKGVAPDASGDRIQQQSLFGKLRFRGRHDLTPWVRGEVRRRFDFRCCESIDEFNETTRLAMTANRHIKIGSDRHEKDDRPRAVDPRHYVLGWDNREKKRYVAERIDQLRSELVALERTKAEESRALESLRERKESATAALAVRDFDAVDASRHQDEIAALQREKAELETSNEAVRALRERLSRAEEEQQTLSDRRDDTLRDEEALTREIQASKQLMANAQKTIKNAQVGGTYEPHALQFESIRASLGDPALSAEDLFDREKRWNDITRRAVESLRKATQPLGERLVEAMSRFLREFKEEQDDLNASVHALASFLGLLDQIRHEDLPRHEKKFKDRLNDKVSQEVALFSVALRQECTHIEGKISQLNEALSQLEYQPGTFMRLEPREVNDREITDFRRSLRECLDDSLDNTDETNEARFLRIQKLVARLSDKENTRWRDKVIDVRRWYDFAAREIEAESGQTRSFYEDSAGQSGGEKAKLAFTILVAAIAYQYDLDPNGMTPGRFQFVMVDEMFSKVDDQNAQYALKLFEQFGLQLLIVAPLDAKARVTEPFVDCYLHVVKDETTHRSELYSMTAREYEDVVQGFADNGTEPMGRHVVAK